MRLLVISDIHGCLNELIYLLKKVKYNPNEDKLILLGDYVDRGKQSMETVLFIGELVENGVIALIGNHDYMFKELVDANELNQTFTDPYYIKLGVDITARGYNELDLPNKQRVMEILGALLPYHIEDDYVFVHGGVDSSLPVEENDLQELIWLREKFHNNEAYSDKITVFGHTPTCNLNDDRKFNIWYDKKYKDKIGIDCGCIYGGRLACLDLTNSIEYYV